MLSDDIYTYIEQNFNIKITDYQFKRDYIKNPLNRGEKPYKEDLEYLYIELNIRREDVAKLFNYKITKFRSVLRHFNIKKSPKLVILNTKNTVIDRYNVTNISKLEKIKEKIQLTNEKRYGSKFLINNKDLRKKMENTSLERYGSKYFVSSKYNIHTSMSKQEEEIYKLLQEKYVDVKRQYKSELYPFACDFYIPSEDLYIEYQGHWTHDNEQFIGKQKQWDKISILKNKKSKYYNKKIYVWMYLDNLKRTYVIYNNLKWLEFFNMKQFMDWYNIKN